MQCVNCPAWTFTAAGSEGSRRETEKEVIALLLCPAFFVADSIDNVAQMVYNTAKWRDPMNKTISMSIRVSEEELDRLKTAARLLSYSSYSEFVRRTALMEAAKVIKEDAVSQDRGKAQ